MTKTERIPRLGVLRHAYAVLDGIPDPQVTLHMWHTSGPLETTANTVACVCTWLARHPDFAVPGYELVASDYDEWCFVARSKDRAKGLTESQANIDYVSDLFGLDYRVAWSLFADRNCSSAHKLPDSDTLTDKQLWQARIRQFLSSLEPGLRPV